MPRNPVLHIRGALTEAFDVPLDELLALPRRVLLADLHCVTGWSATGLRWEGVPFGAVYRGLVEPRLRPGAAVSHVVFGGLDGYRSTVLLEDALADDVLLAHRLDGRPLGGDHGAPLRLVSPQQYGYVSTKHLHRIEVHVAEPTPYLPLRLLGAHPRARVWQEERHRYLPAWSLRHVYRWTIRPVTYLAGRRRTSDVPTTL